MSRNFRQLICSAALSCAAIAAAVPGLAREQADVQATRPEANQRTLTLQVQAVVTAIDLKSRQVTLKGQEGNTITLTAGEEVVDLEEVSVGDTLRATYMAALEGELREPTEEEKANPFVNVADSGSGVVDGAAALGAARQIHAVCTIEGINRLLGTVTILDPNDKIHVIGGVEPDKMSGISLGQTVVITYTEALALTLEKVGADADADGAEAEDEAEDESARTAGPVQLALGGGQ
jgi:hypothetical protein